MKNLIISICIAFTISSSAQTKTELIYEGQNIILSIADKPLDAEKKQIHNSMLSVLNSEYDVISKDYPDKTFAEGYMENQQVSERFSMEAMEYGSRWKIVFKMERQERNQNTGQWNRFSEIPRWYYVKIHKKIYESVNGPIVFPEDFVQKISFYNAKQKKDKNKIIIGRDL